MNQRSVNLYHHGIKGQHWGKRRGPPYPLDTNRKYNSFLGQDRTDDIRIKKKELRRIEFKVAMPKKKDKCMCLLTS